jgi:membrane protease YdiL (CAAX protease family)
VKALRGWFRAALVDVVPRDHTQTDAQFRRRRVVVAATLVAGAVLLGVSLAIRPGDPLFYVMTTAVAGVWIGGAALSGPLHLGWMPYRGNLRRPIITPIVTGLLIGAMFVLGGLILPQLPALRDSANEVLNHARAGSIVVIAIVTLLNGVAEEVFFRGALFAAIGRSHPVLISTGVYALATVVTANPLLVFAALLLGAVLGLQRRASGGILGPILTHVTWSTIMLFALPAIIPP